MCWWHSFEGTDTVTGITRTFFIEYRIINPGYISNRPILGQQPYYRKKGLAPAYVMVKAGVFPTDELPGKQITNYFPTADLKTASHPFYLSVGDCSFSEDRTNGYISVSDSSAAHPYFMSDEGTMEWDLEIFKSIACHTGFACSPFMTMLGAFDSFWHAEGIRASFHGSVTLDDVTYEVLPETSFGYADKHWGKKYNSPRLHLSSCKLRSKRTGNLLKYSALAIDGCCPRVFFFPLRPKLMVQLTYTGEDFCFPILKPGIISRVLWKKKETKKRFVWHIKGQNNKSLIKISMNSLKSDMMALDYEEPSGHREKAPLYAGANGLGTIELYRITPNGKQWIDTLEIENAFCEYQKA